MKNQIKELESFKGSGTELVSLYIPHDKNLSKIRGRMNSEISEAESIKSKSTRKKVQSALKSIVNVLNQYKETPENGMVLFASSEDVFVFDSLKTPVQSSRYKCDSDFYTKPLQSLISNSNDYGLVVITENKATIGVLRGNIILEKKTIESGLHGKHKAGGQSAQRFDRDRKQKKKKYFNKVGESVSKILPDNCELLIGGVDITRKDFVRGDYLPHDIEILGQFNVNYSEKSGLEELAERGKDILSENEINKEREILEKFYKSLRDGQDAYGIKKVEEYLEQGRVETLILSEEIKNEELVEKAKNIGSEVIYISTSFDKGEQFNQNFDGIGAILRW